VLLYKHRGLHGAPHPVGDKAEHHETGGIVHLIGMNPLVLVFQAVLPVVPAPVHRPVFLAGIDGGEVSLDKLLRIMVVDVVIAGDRDEEVVVLGQVTLGRMLQSERAEIVLHPTAKSDKSCESQPKSALGDERAHTPVHPAGMLSSSEAVSILRVLLSSRCRFSTPGCPLRGIYPGCSF
jgi:hypothetical protein